MSFKTFKLLVAVFLFTFFYSFVLAFGMSVIHTLTISFDKTVLSEESSVIFTALFDGTKNSSNTYAWYIDGVPLKGVETASLNIKRDTYLSLFPDEKHQDIEKNVSVKTLVSNEMISDTTSLYVDYKEDFCGNGILEHSLGEECDDGNILNGDGCSTTCLCEGICVSLLVQ